jgi:uncharacterized protein YbjT (DUF2867 family)
MQSQNTILVTGATGRQGGAVTRHLLLSGFKVRALTRNPNSPKAKVLKKLGAITVKGNLNEPDSIRPAFEDLYGVFSVQNPWITGLKKEVEHGIRVAEMAAKAGVQFLVYASAGTGESDTGVPHFNSKLEVEEFIRSVGIHYTILRPNSFMELMFDRDFFPSLVAWSVKEKIIGFDRSVLWISTDDVGAIAAKIFANPTLYLGKDLMLASDKKSMNECRKTYKSVFGKKPFQIPAPVWLFKLMQNDLYRMFQWMKTWEETEDIIRQTKVIRPEVKNLREWMESKKNDKN